MAESVGGPMPSKTPSSHRKPDFDGGKIGAETESLKSRSYVAMGLSMILPGLGQLYLGRSLKGFLLFFSICFSARHCLSQFHASKRMA